MLHSHLPRASVCAADPLVIDYPDSAPETMKPSLAQVSRLVTLANQAYPGIAMAAGCLRGQNDGRATESEVLDWFRTALYQVSRSDSTSGTEGFAPSYSAPSSSIPPCSFPVVDELEHQFGSVYVPDSVLLAEPIGPRFGNAGTDSLNILTVEPKWLSTEIDGDFQLTQQGSQ